MKERKKPLLPDGSEVWVGLAAAVILGLGMVFADLHPMFYIPAVVIMFLGCVYGIQIWSEEDRQYWRAVAINAELEDLERSILEAATEIKKTGVRKNARDGMQDCGLIIDELLKKKPTVMYGGFSDLVVYVRRLAAMLPEYIDIQDHPQKAGIEYDDKMTLSEQGIQGFREQMARMLERVNRGDITDLTVNAELLRSLRSLINKNQEMVK